MFSHSRGTGYGDTVGPMANRCLYNSDHQFSSRRRANNFLAASARWKPEPMIAKISQETLAEMIGTTR
jgi:hypothetical protein